MQWKPMFTFEQLWFSLKVCLDVRPHGNKVLSVAKCRGTPRAVRMSGPPAQAPAQGLVVPSSPGPGDDVKDKIPP